ncbi:Fip [Desulfosporosinus sp. I2]|uniref:DUF6710 family protein n=1 Tax=Desulfosporosinus sp. I2 TaxID=1617025 RepID=UPI00061E95D7|nr:DUF6710 family protein [Desulfosporosinus sp. I2]KJR47369.1 Fip [Desulfosporosinus sp. I2]
MFESFWRKTFRKEEQLKVQPSWEFNYAMDFVRQTLRYEHSKEDQNVILAYMLSLIREDLKSDLLTTILYNKESFDKEISYPFPLSYENELGNQIWLDSEETQIKRVDLANDCVLVLSWNRDRMRNSIKNIARNPFEFSRTNHLAYYFTYIDICYAYNGTHSISSGIGHKKGVIEAKTVDITPMFDHVYTDGVNWYSQHNGMKLKALWDFRIGVIYEVSKIKYKLENEQW